VPGGRSASQGRTARYPRAVSPLITTEPPDAHPETRTVRTLHADCPRATRAVRTVRDLRADGPPNGSKREHSRASEKHEEHLDEIHLADSPPATRGQSAWHGNSNPSLKSKEPNHLPVHGSPKRLKLLTKDLGKVWSIPRGCYVPKHGSSNELNRRESNRNRVQPKT
jgi:hypothetical protein